MLPGCLQMHFNPSKHSRFTYNQNFFLLSSSQANYFWSNCHILISRPYGLQLSAPAGNKRQMLGIDAKEDWFLKGRLVVKSCPFKKLNSFLNLFIWKYQVNHILKWCGNEPFLDCSNKQTYKTVTQTNQQSRQKQTNNKPKQTDKQNEGQKDCLEYEGGCCQG